MIVTVVMLPPWQLQSQPTTKHLATTLHPPNQFPSPFHSLARSIHLSHRRLCSLNTIQLPHSLGSLDLLSLSVSPILNESIFYKRPQDSSH